MLSLKVKWLIQKLMLSRLMFRLTYVISIYTILQTALHINTNERLISISDLWPCNRRAFLAQISYGQSVTAIIDCDY